VDVLKNFKKTIFWFIALAALFGASQLIDDRVEEAERVEQANLKLFPFEIGQVAEFWINSAKDGVRARLSKETDGWRLNQPLAAKGDDEAVTNLLRNIVNSRKDAILFENPEPAKLAELGLDKPELEISFKTRDGVTTMEFGDKGPTLNVTYGRFKGETAIYRIHSDVRTEADTSVYTLRDKSTLVFDPLKLKRMEIMRALGYAAAATGPRRSGKSSGNPVRHQGYAGEGVYRRGTQRSGPIWAAASQHFCNDHRAGQGRGPGSVHRWQGPKAAGLFRPQQQQSKCCPAGGKTRQIPARRR
jgi:hypothetical protein